MAADKRLEPGRVLCGKWRIDEQLGEGGMATVWAATHRNGMRVAIKALRPELSHDGEVSARFLREGYVANRIRHPGVLKILDDDRTDDDVVFLVMELLEGIGLKQLWLEQNRQLPPSMVVSIAQQVLEVLEAAHAQGVVHRDLKPDNVFILDSGGITILDFGIARLREIEGVDQRTRTGAMLGTPAFMPPEQALGHWDKVDARSDLFALGATMWTLLTGGLVHAAETMQELLVAAATKQASAVQTVLPQLDGRLARVIDRALRFDPSERWESAAAMRRALEPVARAGSSTDVMERPAPPTQKVGVHGSWQSLTEELRVPPPPTQVLPTVLDRNTPTTVLPERASKSPATAAMSQQEFNTAVPFTSPLPVEHNRRAILLGVVGGAALAVVGFAWLVMGSSTETTPVQASRSPEPPVVEAPEVSAKPPPVEPSASASAESREPPPRVPPPTKSPSRPTLDCRGKDFANPACAKP
ncbi:MAG TPA: serine/threonine-protein kinase [Polyangiaceae bacterium]|jgi:serine/threonine-protein kinase|nr:serine/threonine-protein kinase [Polyangiaceae bacterium]